MNKFEDIMNAIKLNEFMKKDDEKKCSPVVCILAIVGAVIAVAAIAYAVYRHFTPDYLEDFDEDEYDDFDDEDFDDDVLEFSSLNDED